LSIYTWLQDVSPLLCRTPTASHPTTYQRPIPTDAVSVASGGIVSKFSLGAAGYVSSSGSSFDDDEDEDGYLAGGAGSKGRGGRGRGGRGGGTSPRARLMVDDPLTGRDISAGTYR